MDALPPASPAADLHPYAAAAFAVSKMRESADIAKIAPALVRAQAAMENPPRNRSVQVRTQAGSYTFRYATLDKITDMIRAALGENGLCLLQPIVGTERGPALVTRLLHESGQWMECEVLLPALGNNPQAFGSAVTYVRRYSVCALLNISGDEDDDANRAAGNHYTDAEPAAGARKAPGNRRADAGPGRPAAPTQPDAEPGASEPAQAAARALIVRARAAENVDHGHVLLDIWQRERERIETLRGTKPWEEIERELGAALKRSLGTEPAAAFVAALRASDAKQVQNLQSLWEGRWADTLSAMQQEAPATYALLRRHVAAQIERVRGAAGTAAPAFDAQLRDETGEIASDPIADAADFARAYADLWHATDVDVRRDLARHNAAALGQVAQDAQARVILNALAAERSAERGRAAGATAAGR